jgi:NADH-quinone oxidoreductase subunit J
MTILFYLSAVVAIFSTIMVITRLNPVHALLYFIVSLLSVALIFFILGAPFVAALEVIIYAGAIMVLFVFVVMLLNRGPQTVAEERQWLDPQMWVGPAVLAVILIGELAYVLNQGAAGSTGARQATRGPTDRLAQAVDARQVGIALFGPYVLGTELASMLLLAGLVGAYHLGRREEKAPGAWRLAPGSDECKTASRTANIPSGQEPGARRQERERSEP